VDISTGDDAQHASTSATTLYAQPGKSVKAAPELPQRPQLMRDLDLSIEDPRDHHRRLAWIAHYVRNKEFIHAWQLGWDGKPFDTCERDPNDNELLQMDMRSNISSCWNEDDEHASSWA